MQPVPYVSIPMDLKAKVTDRHNDSTSDEEKKYRDQFIMKEYWYILKGKTKIKIIGNGKKLLSYFSFNV